MGISVVNETLAIANFTTLENLKIEKIKVRFLDRKLYFLYKKCIKNHVIVIFSYQLIENTKYCTKFLP